MLASVVRRVHSFVMRGHGNGSISRTQTTFSAQAHSLLTLAESPLSWFYISFSRPVQCVAWCLPASFAWPVFSTGKELHVRVAAAGPTVTVPITRPNHCPHPASPPFSSTYVFSDLTRSSTLISAAAWLVCRDFQCIELIHWPCGRPSITSSPSTGLVLHSSTGRRSMLTLLL